MKLRKFDSLVDANENITVMINPSGMVYSGTFGDAPQYVLDREVSDFDKVYAENGEYAGIWFVVKPNF